MAICSYLKKKKYFVQNVFEVCTVQVTRHYCVSDFIQVSSRDSDYRQRALLRYNAVGQMPRVSHHVCALRYAISQRYQAISLTSQRGARAARKHAFSHTWMTRNTPRHTSFIERRQTIAHMHTANVARTRRNILRSAPRKGPI